MKISPPQLGRSYDVREETLNPYTPAEQTKALPRLRGRSLLIDFQRDIDGPQTATRLIRDTLGNLGVSWVESIDQAEALIWIQSGSSAMKFAFVVAAPDGSERFVAAECGPRELTATIMTGVCEYFNLIPGETSKDELSAALSRVNELNRAITGRALAQDWRKACYLMNELKDAIQEVGAIGGSEAIKPVVDALADSAQSYEVNGFPEAKALREAAIEALRNIGREAIPWIRKGFTDSRPAVRKACHRALKACGGKPWWQVW